MRKGKMKLTKETLKRIIKEELEAFVNEVEEEALEEEQDLEETRQKDLPGYAADVRTTANIKKMLAKQAGLTDDERKAQYDLQKPKDDIATALADEQRADLAAQEKGRKPLDTNMGPTDVTKNLKAYDKKNPWYRR